MAKSIDSTISWLALTALFLIPLTISYFGWAAIYGEPRVVTLHLLAGLILILWAVRAALTFRESSPNGQVANSLDLRKWLDRNPARWAIASVAALILVKIMSTLLSPIPYVSFFGADEARTGYNLYDGLSIALIFFTVAFGFRDRIRIERLIYVLVISGGIAASYGLAQNFGWDPIAGNEGRVRPIASFGNTLNFAAYLVMAVPATLALAYRYLDSGNYRWLSVTILTLGIQLAALWITGARGSYVAVAVAVLIFFVTALFLLDRKRVWQIMGLLIIGATFAGIISAVPTPQGSTALTRFTSIGDQLKGDSSTVTKLDTGGLIGRFNIWESTLKVVTEWPTPVEEPFINRALRPVFGLGPDMFVYSFPAVGKPQSEVQRLDRTHNHPLQILAEQGYAGLTLLVGSSVFLVLAGFSVIRKLHSFPSRSMNEHWIVLAVLPAAVGKLIELQTGALSISDMTMTMAIFAAVLVVYELVNSSRKNNLNPHLRTTSTPKVGLRFLGAAFVVIVLTGLVFTTFVGWDLRRLSAGLMLVDAEYEPDLDKKGELWSKAQAKAPDREYITHALSRAYLDEAILAFARNDDQTAVELAKYAHSLLLDYEKIDPFQWDVQQLLAEITSYLVDWGETEYAQELADRWRKLVDLYPSYPAFLSVAAANVVKVGLDDLAIEYADRAIGMEETTRSWPAAWYAKGQALHNLNRDEEAIKVLLIGIDKQPKDEAWVLSNDLLANIYLARGDVGAAEHHKNLARGD